MTPPPRTPRCSASIYRWYEEVRFFLYSLTPYAYHYGLFCLLHVQQPINTSEARPSVLLLPWLLKQTRASKQLTGCPFPLDGFGLKSRLARAQSVSSGPQRPPRANTALMNDTRVRIQTQQTSMR